jgi:hypothetical protein
MVIVLLAQAALPPVSAPTPVLVSVPSVDAIGRDPRARERTRVAVIMKAEGRTLYDGALWVGRRAPASWRQTVQEAPVPACAPATPWDARGNEISVQVMPRFDDPGAAERFVVTVRWQRPGDAPCSGARTVELRESVTLGGGPVVLRGDAGLTVEVRRR